jgi:putative transposase
LQSKLEDGRYSSERIRRLYRKRTRRRDHAQEALCRDLLDWLYAEGVDTVYIGGLTDVLETHWSVASDAEGGSGERGGPFSYLWRCSRPRT